MSFFLLQIAILITNGRSEDPVDSASRAVADNGITLFAVGEFEFFQPLFKFDPNLSLLSAVFVVRTLCPCPIYWNSWICF